MRFILLNISKISQYYAHRKVDGHLWNKKGFYTINPKYDYERGLKDGITAVRKNKFFGVCDLRGKFVVEPVYDYVEYIGKNTFRVENNEKLGYFKQDGSWIWNPSE